MGGAVLCHYCIGQPYPYEHVLEEGHLRTSFSSRHEFKTALHPFTVALRVRITIIDDHAEMRAMVRRFLTDLADEFREYSDGPSALSHYDQDRPDWTVVDIVMPGMDGLAVTSSIKRRDPAARVVVITQNNNPKLAALARETGATAFVLKENLLELRRLIMSDLGRASVTDRAP